MSSNGFLSFINKLIIVKIAAQIKNYLFGSGYIEMKLYFKNNFKFIKGFKSLHRKNIIYAWMYHNYKLIQRTTSIQSKIYDLKATLITTNLHKYKTADTTF